MLLHQNKIRTRCIQTCNTILAPHLPRVSRIVVIIGVEGGLEVASRRRKKELGSLPRCAGHGAELLDQVLSLGGHFVGGRGRGCDPRYEGVVAEE